jgi:hypothetical protein
MDIYIDEVNLESFISQKSNPLFDDSLKLLKKQLDLRFNFSKDKLKENSNLTPLIPILTSGLGNTQITFNNDFPSRPLKSNSANDFDPNQLSAIYWVSDNDCNKLIDSGSVILGELGQEINIINQLFFLQEDYLFEKKWRINGSGFTNWTDIQDYSLPLTDIIIVDNYILSSREIFATNLLNYLSVLMAKCQCKANVVIYVHPDRIDGDETEILKGIKKCIKDSTGKKGSTTLIKTRKEHDRTILTNYKRIYSGDTFNFWDSAGTKITKGKEIIYSSNARSDNHKLFKDMIKDLQDIIDKNPENISGDKVSGFLNF